MEHPLWPSPSCLVSSTTKIMKASIVAVPISVASLFTIIAIATPQWTLAHDKEWSRGSTYDFGLFRACAPDCDAYGEGTWAGFGEPWRKAAGIMFAFVSGASWPHAHLPEMNHKNASFFRFTTFLPSSLPTFDNLPCLYRPAIMAYNSIYEIALIALASLPLTVRGCLVLLTEQVFPSFHFHSAFP
ncbi:hypothetical protein BDZ88DRAFT_62376 [Geranomyces variabilis]|nr:hypothetical protein BDZ88DRAFT_62376 [Geranomyces variabilis]